MRSSIRKFAVAAGCAALLLTGCSTGDKQGEATPATTSSGATTTAPPAVDPPTDSERTWVKQLHRIRPRIDKAFERNLRITRASMEGLVRVLDTCEASLKDAGRPSGRFKQAALIAREACDRYETAGTQLQQAIAVSDASGAVVAGTSEETVFNRALEHAFAAQGNASNMMIRAEVKADQLLADIKAQSSE